MMHRKSRQISLVKTDLHSIKVDGVFHHTPVLASFIADALIQNPDGVYVDGTVGGGGHAAALLERLSPRGRILGFDKDSDAVVAVRRRFEGNCQFSVIQSNFEDIPFQLDHYGISHVHGILLDLGVSSYQLDTVSRGFSFMTDGPLDMRMDQSLKTTARDLVNDMTQNELAEVFFVFGEERFARPIARAIVQARSRQPIETTAQLAEIIRSVVHYGPINKSCARVFQALRIALNRELDVLQATLTPLVSRLTGGGRLAVLSYHSLEDRIVKQTFQALAKGCVCPSDWPQCVCGKKPAVSFFAKRIISAPEAEVAKNPRARSAKLRLVERLTDGLTGLPVSI